MDYQALEELAASIKTHDSNIRKRKTVIISASSKNKAFRTHGALGAS